VLAPSGVRLFSEREDLVNRHRLRMHNGRQ
jgi:hypothetical protein